MTACAVPGSAVPSGSYQYGGELSFSVSLAGTAVPFLPRPGYSPAITQWGASALAWLCGAAGDQDWLDELRARQEDEDTTRLLARQLGLGDTLADVLDRKRAEMGL